MKIMVERAIDACVPCPPQGGHQRECRRFLCSARFAAVINMGDLEAGHNDTHANHQCDSLSPR